MFIEELVEGLEELIGPGVTLKTNSKGQIVIHTSLVEDENGLLKNKGGEYDDDFEDPDGDFSS